MWCGRYVTNVLKEHVVCIFRVERWRRCCVIWIISNVLEELVASNFRVK
jgi:hypothetical protein